MSKGRTNLSKVFEMLNTCAKGYQAKLGPHSYIVTFGDRIMTNLPKGGHDTKDEVDLFYVRKLVQNLGIDEECARSVIPALPRIKKTSDG